MDFPSDSTLSSQKVFISFMLVRKKTLATAIPNDTEKIKKYLSDSFSDIYMSKIRPKNNLSDSFPLPFTNFL
jgi:hypothetical protein